MEQEHGQPRRGDWSTRKKDDAPRGVYRHPSGGWGIRFACGLGHVHKQRTGSLKSAAIREHDERRVRAQREPGWCPRSERHAAQELVRQQAEARRNDEARAITLREYSEHWLRVHVEPNCRERTVEQYRSALSRHVYPVLGGVPLGALKRTQVKEFFATKAAEGLARGTLRNIAVPLSAMLNAAVEDERIPGNPAARLWRHQRGRTEREARKVTALSAAELGRVLQAAKEHHPEHNDMIHVLAWTGLRLSETCGLQWGDIDFEGTFLEVNRTVSYRACRIIIAAPKSGRARRVDLPQALVGRLRARQGLLEAEAVLAGRDLSPWVFPAPSDETKPINAAFIRFKVWYKVLRRAGLRAVRLHDLRHTYASLLLEAGEPMIYVKEQLGHSTIQVTVDLYGHIRAGANRQAVDRLAALTEAPSGADVPMLSPSQLARN
jgi:integrase